MTRMITVFEDAVDEINAGDLKLHAVVDCPSLEVVDGALVERGSVMVRLMEFDDVIIPPAFDAGAVLAQNDEDPKKEAPVELTLHLRIRWVELKDIRSLTKEPDGTYSFMGTHHSEYSWERNYNAGWQTEHSATHYRISAHRDGRATYSVEKSEIKTRLN